jgi:hypothetical protein
VVGIELDAGILGLKHEIPGGTAWNFWQIGAFWCVFDVFKSILRASKSIYPVKNVHFLDGPCGSFALQIPVSC